MADLIRRQDAIEVIEQLLSTPYGTTIVYKGDIVSRKVALDALWKIGEEENQPSAQSTMGQQNDGDTISRRMAIDAMANTLWHYPNECYRNLNEYEFAKSLAELGLKSVPAAQPEIIHCRDCENWDKTWTNDFSPNYHYCPMVDGVRNDNFYCADAERRTDGCR